MRLFRLLLAVVACLAAAIPSAVGKKSPRGPLLSTTASQSLATPLGHASNNRAESTPLSNIKSSDDVARNVAVSSRGGASVPTGSIPVDALSGAIAMGLLERLINKIFVAKGIAFPSPLGGCLSLLAFLLLADFAKPGLGESVFAKLAPGQAFLTKWLPVFFVPGIAMLPLAPSMGSGIEAAKVLLVVVLGWAFTLSTVAYSVLFLRGAMGTLNNSPPAAAPVANEGKGGQPAAPAAKPFADETMAFLTNGAVVTAAVSIYATKTANSLATPIQTVFLLFSTVAAFVWAGRLPPSFNNAIHPLVTTTVSALGILKLTGLLTGREFLDVLRTYKVGSLKLAEAGAGDFLLFLLNPAIVSFGVAMYGKKKLLKENFVIVLAAILISSVGGLFGTAVFVRAIQLGGENGAFLRLSVLSRNVTTALSMIIADLLGGDISIAASVVVLTGIWGATYAKRALDVLGIHDPVTRGLAIGASSQSLGVASIVQEKDAFPFGAISMVLTAISATILVSFPAVKETLISLVEN